MKKAGRVLKVGFVSIALAGAVLTLEDQLRTPGESVIDRVTIAMSDGSSAYPRQIRNPQTPQQKHLAYLVAKASSSPTGAMIVGNLLDDGVLMHLDKSLDKTNACGFFTMGSYNHSFNLLQLNPADRVSEVKRVAVVVHEGRHHMQSEVGADPYTSYNVPDHERVILKWIKEADARMTSILFAWEQKTQGVPDYYDQLKSNGGHKKMVEAFEASLEAHPGDVKSAARAAIRASYEMDNYERDYANSMMSWMESNNVSHRGHRRSHTILHDSLLMAIGDIGTYGNYMDAELMRDIRTSFTAQDFAELSQIRKEAGGSKGAACGGNDNKKPDVKTPVKVPSVS